MIAILLPSLIFTLIVLALVGIILVARSQLVASGNININVKQNISNACSNAKVLESWYYSSCRQQHKSPPLHQSHLLTPEIKEDLVGGK